MAIGDSYASTEEYRARQRRSDNAADIEIADDLLAVSRYIDRITGYTATGFNADVADDTRYYTVPARNRDQDVLWVDPLSAAPTSVTVDSDNDGEFTDETALALTQPSGDLLYLPMNRGSGPEARPITGFRMTRWNTGDFDLWPTGHLVQVIGKFGWPAVPAAVKAATIELTGIWRIESPRATEQVTELDTVTRTSNEAQRIVRGLIATFRRAGVLL